MQPMKKVELTILIHKDAKLQDEIDTINAHLDKIGAVIISAKNEGMKRLAYRVEGQEQATYFSYELSLPSDKQVELSEWLGERESILRYLIIRV